MKTMRRYFAMLLTLIMSFSLVTSAAAAETKTVVVGDVSIDFGVEEIHGHAPRRLGILG